MTPRMTPHDTDLSSRMARLREIGIDICPVAATEEAIEEWRDNVRRGGALRPVHLLSPLECVAHMHQWGQPTQEISSLTGAVIKTFSPSSPAGAEDGESLFQFLVHPDERVVAAAMRAVRRLDNDPVRLKKTIRDVQQWKNTRSGYRMVRQRVIAQLESYQENSAAGEDPGDREARWSQAFRYGPPWWTPLTAAAMRPLEGMGTVLIGEAALLSIFESCELLESWKTRKDDLMSVIGATDSALWDMRSWHSWCAANLPLTEGTLAGFLHAQVAPELIVALLRRPGLSPQQVLDISAAWPQLSTASLLECGIPMQLLLQGTEGSAVRVPRQWEEIAARATRSVDTASPVEWPGMPLRTLAPHSKDLPLPEGSTTALLAIDSNAGVVTVMLRLIGGQTSGLVEWVEAECQAPSDFPGLLVHMPGHWTQWSQVMTEIVKRVTTCEEWVRVLNAVMSVPNAWGLTSPNGTLIGDILARELVRLPIPRELGSLSTAHCRALMSSPEKVLRETGIRLAGRLVRPEASPAESLKSMTPPIAATQQKESRRR